MCVRTYVRLYNRKCFDRENALHLQIEYKESFSKKVPFLSFAKIYARKLHENQQFAKINARQIFGRAIRENKCSRKLMLAKINAREN